MSEDENDQLIYTRYLVTKSLNMEGIEYPSLPDAKRALSELLYEHLLNDEPGATFSIIAVNYHKGDEASGIYRACTTHLTLQSPGN